MAIKGSLVISGASVQNAYLRLGTISGGKQVGFWQSDVQIFGDGGVAALAYEAAKANDSNADATAMNASKVSLNIQEISAVYSSSLTPYTSLYTALKLLFPTLTDA